MAFGVVVITGAAGALGSATAAYLTRKDIQVVGIDIADTAPPEAELEHYLLLSREQQSMLKEQNMIGDRALQLACTAADSATSP